MLFRVTIDVMHSVGRGEGMRRGVPNVLMQQDNRTQRITQSVIPPPEQAAQMYRDNVGRLTDPAPFGSDPLAESHERKIIRETSFGSRYPSYEDIFHQLVNGDSTNFRRALLFYIDITKRLSSS